MDLVDDQCVLGRDEAVLEPAPRDPGRDNHDVPCGRLGRRFALAIDHPDLERRLEDRLRHRADGQRLSGAGPRNDPEPLT